MDLISQTYNDIADQQVIKHDAILENGMQIRANIAIVTDKFIDYQKDLITEFIEELNSE
jgi:hypothetical protein